MGSRHWAAAAISRRTKALAVVVSQSTGTVRLYQNGNLVIRIEPMDKACEVARILVRLATPRRRRLRRISRCRALHRLHGKT